MPQSDAIYFAQATTLAVHKVYVWPSAT